MAAMTGGALALVLSTAALIHATWYNASRSASRELASEINRQITDSVRQQLAQVIANAEAARESLHTIFFQDVIRITDEAKREFTFLAALQSQPSLSWVAFGWPNGDFFGAEKRGKNGVGMVEVRPEGPGKVRQRRVDTYLGASDGDIVFQKRDFESSDFRSTEQDWYRRATVADAPVWVDADLFPTRRRPAVANAAPLRVYGKFVGVLMVAIELDRLSAHLAGIRVARSGTAFIADQRERVVAFPDSAALGAEEGDSPAMRRLADVPQPHVQVAARGLGMAGLDGREAMVRWQDGNQYLVSAAKLGFGDWEVVTVIPEADFLEEIDRTTRRLLVGLAGFALAAAGLAVWLVTVFVTRPLQRVAGQLRHVEEFRLERVTSTPSRLREIDDLSAGLKQMSGGLASFQKFLPTELVRTLVAQGIEAKPGGRQRELTLMFADLAGFTRLSERLGDRVVPILADYLGRMSDIVHGAGGTIDKFIGDAVMAFWNAPNDDPDHAVNACRAALEGQRMMAALGRHTDALGLPPLKMRVGVNSGAVLVGNIGSSQRLNYTAIGDPVNVASRLESINKRYGTGIILGESTRTAAGAAIIARRLDRVAVYGREGGIDLYELLGMAGDAGAEAALTWAGRYETGLELYRKRAWAGAAAAFEGAIALRGADAPSVLMIERCRALMRDPPPGDWDGTASLDMK
ncbi:MAG: adenylate/guanylate cyclase domain-containing protein [Rhodospirillales bacterium]